VVLLDEEDEGEDNLDEEEEDLDIGTEVDSPPWNYVQVDPELDDNDDSNEDTALLRSKTPHTEIVITPISPVCISTIFIVKYNSILFNLK
jgi:hypothetical protein